MYAFNITLLIKILNLACVLRNQRLIEHPIIKLLLEKKEIDINIEDSQGKKPIDYSKNIEIKQLLLK